MQFTVTSKKHNPIHYLLVIALNLFYMAKVQELPFAYDIYQKLASMAGPWYSNAPSWWTMVVGLPLFLTGMIFFLTSFSQLYFSIFNRQYNIAHCRFCPHAIKIKPSVEK